MHTYLGHLFTMLGLQAFLDSLKVAVFIVVLRRFEVAIHSIYRTGSHGGHWRRTRREESNKGMAER